MGSMIVRIMYFKVAAWVDPPSHKQTESIRVFTKILKIKHICCLKGTHRHKNGIDRMIDNPFWKVFFKKLNAGIT